MSESLPARRGFDRPCRADDAWRGRPAVRSARVAPPARHPASVPRASAVLLAAVMLAWLGTASAAVYRWVDEAGKVHYSQVVPERYRDAARELDLSHSVATPEQTRDARERARRDKARAAEIPARGAPPSEAPAPPASVPGTSGKRPAMVPGDDTDCETWERLYRESIECFGPFRLATGGVRPAAFDACNEVREPPPGCRRRLP